MKQGTDSLDQRDKKHFELCAIITTNLFHDSNPKNQVPNKQILVMKHKDLTCQIIGSANHLGNEFQDVY